ncbi:MAG: DUF1007 family protein [Pseudolabrys sp.]|jgi:ABC-type uncharacterized transport system substrate-binding protein|nr:DUF1007 family protein [Pseudolabrys sp.]
MIFRLKLIVLAFLAAAAVAPRAEAHPHVWVTFHTQLVYDKAGQLTGIRHEWAFDDMFSVFATQGIDSKEKGKFTREELAPLAEVNVTSLKEYDYFTFVKADGKTVALTDPAKGTYWLTFEDSILTLHFTLPLKHPVKAHNLSVDVYDPSIFVDFEFAKKDPVALDGAPPGCTLTTGLPRQLTTAEAQALSQIPADVQNTTMVFGDQMANKILVTCP